MPLKTRIFHEISAVCNRRSNLSEIPYRPKVKNPRGTTRQTPIDELKPPIDPRPSPFRGLFFRDWRLPYAL